MELVLRHLQFTGVPELTEYGTSPETSPVQEIPELTEYGTNPDTAPIHENSELELTTNDEVRIERLIFLLTSNMQMSFQREVVKSQLQVPKVSGPSRLESTVLMAKWSTVRNCLTRKL